MELDRRAVKLMAGGVVLILVVIMITSFAAKCAKLLVDGADTRTYTRVNSAAELFQVVNDSLYRFEEVINVETESHDKFMEFWHQLDNEFALHSAFRDPDVQLQYKDKDDCCKIRITMKLNACGQAMRYLYMGKGKDYETADAKYVGEKLKEISEEIIEDDMTEEEKVRAIHNYLISNYMYAVDGDVHYYTECAVLFREGKAQCQAYSEAFVALCLLNGVEARVISGQSTFGFGENAHAWCQVKVNSIWYHIDVTWDDPIPDVPNLVRYDFYLKGDFTMDWTHDWASYFEECITDYSA